MKFKALVAVTASLLPAIAPVSASATQTAILPAPAQAAAPAAQKGVSQDLTPSQSDTEIQPDNSPQTIWTDPKTPRPIKKESPAKVVLPPPPAPGQSPDELRQKSLQDFTNNIEGAPNIWIAPPANMPKGSTKHMSGQVVEMTPMQGYLKDLTEKISSKMQVPTSATLVETSNKKYNYLFSFTLNKNGKIANLRAESAIGNLKSNALPDDAESGMVLQAVQNAINASLPLPTPSNGFAPWFMVMQYDLNQNQLQIACLNQR